MNEQRNPLNPLPVINKEWTLFLDRDGVINEEVIGDYIRKQKDFQFRPGSLDALVELAQLFHKVVVVSNQRGVGKGLMTELDLIEITDYMVQEVATAGGRIDKVYYCTSTDNQHPNRKPNKGMALQAQHDFSSIDFTKSIMVGNMPGDLKFGRNIGAFTVYLPTRPDAAPDDATIDASYKDLLSFARSLKESLQIQ
jgi:histidinol-phosphate phosphatase family protein